MGTWIGLLWAWFVEGGGGFTGGGVTDGFDYGGRLRFLDDLFR